MNEVKKGSSFYLLGAILFTVLAVLDLFDLFHYFQYHLPFRILLPMILVVVAQALIAAVLFLQRRDILLCVGFGLYALSALFQLFFIGSKFQSLLLLLAFAAAALAAAALLTDILPALRDTAQKLWFISPICVAAQIILTFFTSISYLLNFGFFPAIQVLFSGILSAGLLAAALFCALYWVVAPEGGSIPGFQAKTKPSGDAYTAGTPYQAAAQARVQQPDATAAAGSLEADAFCKLTNHILLLIFTFGIWNLIWIYRATRWLNCVNDEPPRDPVKKLLLCLFVPFYGIYWTYKSAQRVDALAASRGVASDLSTPCLILAIFVGIVPPILMQEKLNTILAAQNGGVPYTQPQQPMNTPPHPAPSEPQAAPRVVQAPRVSPEPRPQAPRPSQSTPASFSVPDELKKYKELLDMGAITQEEFDEKKRQLLGL